MSNVKEFMRKAHQNKQLSTDEPITLKNKVRNTSAKTDVNKTVESTQTIVDDNPNIPSTVRKIARLDVSTNHYGVKPWQSNLQIYNRDIVRFIRDFSTNNQMNGGCALTKSEMIECVLDVLYYDLEIQPEGFKSPNEFREYLRDKMRNY